ncbi:MAG: S8 family serine peptidase [Robiginitomaculum sp.]|nr:S8 family serine peptidase [Robiginitomaculum sp.]
MQRVFCSILLSFAMALIGNSALADNNKIDLGDGKISEKALSGARVRVQVDFIIPAAEIPEGADGFEIRRGMVKGVRVSLLEQVFGAELINPNTTTNKTLPGGPRLVRKLDNVPSMAMELTLSEMEQLAANPNVKHIYRDAISRVNLAESTVLVGAPVVWSAGSNGSGVAVAVLDSGSSHQHTMMNGRVTGSACFSSSGVTGTGGSTSSFCPDGSESEISPSAGENCPVNDPATTDITEGVSGCSHGTHVASTAMGGTMNLQSGVTLNGVATGANLVAIQVFSRFNDAADCDPDGTPPDPASAPCIRSFTSDQRAELDYVINNAASLNIAAANMSLGGGPEVTNASICDNQFSNALTKALIDQLRTLGVATVIASGNDGFSTGVTAPGCISTAITVGSTTKADSVSGFSNSSELVDLLAPGSSILAAYPLVGGTSYASNSSGTSMAAPHVAGAFALLRSANPGASVQEIEDALKATGTPINDGRVNSIVKPRIRVDLANDLLASGGTGLGDVALTPIAGFLASGDLGDPGNFTTRVYTLTNSGTTVANFTVAGDKNWLGFSVTSGAIPANGGTATVTVSVVTANVTSGQTDSGLITFTVGESSTTRGASLSVASPLLNDDFADAFPLTGITVATSGSSVGATFETGEVEHNIEFNDTGGSSVWFVWTAPLSDNFTVSTEGSNFDSVMSVYTGTGVTALNFITGNDDAPGTPAGGFALASFNAVAGTTYHIVIDGFNGAFGLFGLALNPTSAPGIDNFASASAISTASGSSSTNSVNASAETGEPSHSGQTATKSVWFNWTAPSDGDFTFHTDGSSFDTVLAIYTGTAVNALTEVGANDNQGAASASKITATPGSSQVTFTATNATSYKIAVDGVSGASGLVKLSWFSNAVAQPNLVTAVLPNARSVLVGQTATAFMTVINAGGDGTNCQLSLPSGNFVGGFTYQATDAVNQTIGSPNTPVSIVGSNGVQNFVFGVTPSAEFSEEVLTPLASCNEGTSSSVTTGVNTFTLSSAPIQPADTLTIGATISGNGVIEMQSASGNGFVVVSTAAIGANASLTFSVNDGGAGLPIVTSVCETDPVTAVCLAAPANSVAFDSVNGETRTFAAFISATGDIPFAPGSSRLFVTFDDAGGVSRGGSSVAVRTDFVPPAEVPSVVAGLE